MTDTYKSDQIGYTKLKDRVISTIKLPYPHGEYRYETMMYDPITGEFDDYQQRYMTEDGAMIGHAEAVAFIVGYDKEKQ